MKRSYYRTLTKPFIISVIIFPVVFFVSCKKSVYNPGDPGGSEVIQEKRTHGPQLDLPRTSVTFTRQSNPRPVVITVQKAITPIQHQIGLMWRKSMPEDEGMIFIYKQEQQVGFWMANTLIPLDMIFLDKNRTVVAVIKNAKPLDETTLSPGKLSMYVVEVNGGFASRHGLQVGDKAKWED
ncbi:DUF192 domain-containing protein [Myxococcota bacterium]|nr:DUF192 domain-containing protein [Myxococcota bacterium]MBU1380897.1 DUF192 domain-containing protein [Myxococcota bacterium]MBU1497025.1 DUF192 domain-containing protein [Myxococcota bacterium]